MAIISRENFQKINIAQICSVKSFLNYYNTWYEYRKESGHWFWKKPAGFYFKKTNLSPILWTVEQIEKDKTLYIKDNVVHYKPHVEIRMSNNLLYEIYFETEEGLFEFMESEPMKNINWIDKPLINEG